MGDTRILVFDDHEDTASALHELLVDEGFSVRSTSNIQQAIRWLESEAFSLVLSDYLVAGQEFSDAPAQMLREAAGLTPIGCMTGWKLPESIAERYAFVLMKPSSIEDLLAAVGQSTTPQVGDPLASELIRRYFAELGGGNWKALGALCTASVKYHLPGRGSMSGTIVGRSAFQKHAETVFASFPDANFELVDTAWLPRGAVARYVSRWTSPSGEPLRHPGAVFFAFEGALISEIGVRCDVQQLDQMLLRAS